MQMVRPDGVEATIPPPPGQFKAALLCTAFRAGAEVTISYAAHRMYVACFTSQQCTSGSTCGPHEYMHLVPCNVIRAKVNLPLMGRVVTTIEKTGKGMTKPNQLPFKTLGCDMALLKLQHVVQRREKSAPSGVTTGASIPRSTPTLQL